MASKGSFTIIAAVAVCAGIASVYMVKPRRLADPGWPALYNVLKVGDSQQDVIAKIGKPVSEADNPRFENKSPTEWASVEAQADALARRESDPYGNVSPADRAKYVELSRSLEHRVRSVWTYPSGSPSMDEVALSFDGEGILMRVDVKKPVHSRGSGSIRRSADQAGGQHSEPK